MFLSKQDMTELDINKKTTALVVIDLQKGIAARPTQPHAAKDVIHNAARLTAAFRKNASPVFLVHVTSTPETMLKVKSDTTFSQTGPVPRTGQSSFRRSVTLARILLLQRNSGERSMVPILNSSSAEGAWTRLSCAV